MNPQGWLRVVGAILRGKRIPAATVPGFTLSVVRALLVTVGRSPVTAPDKPKTVVLCRS